MRKREIILALSRAENECERLRGEVAVLIELLKPQPIPVADPYQSDIPLEDWQRRQAKVALQVSHDPAWEVPDIYPDNWGDLEQIEGE